MEFGKGKVPSLVVGPAVMPLATCAKKGARTREALSW